jgi:hypothetical protein
MMPGYHEYPDSYSKAPELYINMPERINGWPFSYKWVNLHVIFSKFIPS